MVTKSKKDQAMVSIGVEEYRELKIQAATEGRSMKFLLGMLIMDYVNLQKERQAQP